MKGKDMQMNQLPKMILFYFLIINLYEEREECYKACQMYSLNDEKTPSFC